MIIIDTAFVPVYIKNIINNLNVQNLVSAKRLVLILVGILLAKKVLMFISMRLLSWFEVRAFYILNEFSYKNFLKHDYHFYKNQFTGSLVSKISRLGDNMVGIVDTFLFSFFSAGVAIISSLYILFRENIWIGFTFLGFLVVYLVLVHFMGIKLTPYNEKASRAKSALGGVYSDILSNIENIIFSGNKEYDFGIFKKANKEYRDKKYQSWKMGVNYQDSIAFVPSLFVGFVTWLSIYLLSNGIVSVGTVVLVFILANGFSQRITWIGGASKRLVSAVADVVEAIEIIETEPQVFVPKSQKFIPQSGDISFEHVSFSYPEGEKVFEDFSLEIASGKQVGLVGKSGSGKSSLTKLLLGLYNLESGKIVLAGNDIAQVDGESLRQQIAYIPQETILFHRSIYDNILYARPEATQEEVLQAAKLAHVDEFVQTMEKGYETMVGERGVKLSGGQRQRVGIARAMLRADAPLLIMDEATSALDSESEFLIQQSFEVAAKGRTTLVIAHRLSTIQKMDTILVFEKGKIVEQGSHEELLKKDGTYARMWNMQENGFIE